MNTNINRLSEPSKHHFFGYYGINPWDKSCKYHLSLETDFDDRRPTVKDIANVGCIDKETNEFIKISETSAFNLQQGTMMHWIDCGYGEEFTYNDYENNNLISYAINFKSKIKRKINGAIAAISPNHSQAIGLNFKRMSYCRPTVGYVHNIKNFELENIPANDGLYALDLKTGNANLMLSIKDVVEKVNVELPLNQPAWFNHVLYNVTGERLLFFCRIKKEEQGFLSSLWTINKDGSDLQCQIPFGYKISHFDWKDEDTILITSNIGGKFGYLEFRDGKKDFRTIGENILTQDGHCSYLPDRNWILSDTYPQGKERLAELFIYKIEKEKKISLGKFHHDIKYKGLVRCDHHPRISNDGRLVSFDSVHEGTRQIYTVDISYIVSSTLSKSLNV